MMNQWKVYLRCGWLLIACIFVHFGCQKNKDTKHTRSSLDIFPVIQDQRWAWGAGAPTLLLRGHFTKDKKEDILIISEPLVQSGKLWRHFTLLQGPALSPAALSVSTIKIEPTLVDYRWGDKTLAIASAQASDINGDGMLDVIVSYRVGRIAVFLGDGTGQSFRLVRVLTSEGDSMMAGGHIQTGDWNGDGKMDIMIAGNAPFLLLWKQGKKMSFTPKVLAYGNKLPSLQKLRRKLRVWPNPSRKNKLAPTSRPVQNDQAIHLSGWLGAKALLGTDFNHDGLLDVVLVGVDQQAQTKIWFLGNRKKQKGWLKKSGIRFVSGQYPNATPMRGAKLKAAFLGSEHRHQDLFLASSLFASLNMRGIGVLRRFSGHEKKAKGIPYASPERLLLRESSLSFGLTVGRFGKDLSRGVVLMSPYRMVGYAPDKKLFRYNLRTDPVIKGRLSLRDAVGCNLNGNGRDALVMLSLGGLQKLDPIGVQILIYRKPLFDQ